MSIFIVVCEQAVRKIELRKCNHDGTDDHDYPLSGNIVGEIGARSHADRHDQPVPQVFTPEINE